MNLARQCPRARLRPHPDDAMPGLHGGALHAELSGGAGQVRVLLHVRRGQLDDAL